MSIQVEIDFKPGDWVERVLKPAVDKGVGKAALVLSTAMSSSMPGPGAALLRLTSGGNKVYSPSNPGTSPGTRTGQLRESISSQRIKQLQWAAGSNLGSGDGLAPYGLFHEFGTADMPARPWARPALARSKRKMMDDFNDMVKREIGRNT